MSGEERGQSARASNGRTQRGNKDWLYLAVELGIGL
jgi:hypothetical protein